MQFLHNCSSAKHIPKELCLRAERRKRMRNVCMHASVRSEYEVCSTVHNFCILHISYHDFLLSGMKMKFILLRDVSFVIVNVFQNCNILVGFCSVVLSDVIWKLFLLHFSS
ncbi:hypothetical protein QL285_027373 [Trifolium repens]|nr:hypothetical protein QL285_027373 [Trifolium repens]